MIKPEPIGEGVSIVELSNQYDIVPQGSNNNLDRANGESRGQKLSRSNKWEKD